MKLAVIILAAGEGTRMRSALPKVLHPVGGRAMLAHVVDTARALAPESISIVYGHGGEVVRDALDGPDLRWCLQAEQKGTAHAVLQALPEIDPHARVLVLYGDVPLMRAATLEGLVDGLSRHALVLLSAKPSSPVGYGRVIRSAAGAVRAIVEDKDASPEERATTEINTGLMAAGAEDLSRWLGKVGNRNAQGEYYLTDCAALAVAEGQSVDAQICENAGEAQGINDKSQLAEVERAYQGRRAEALMRDGVTLLDPARVDIRGSVSVGRDVCIDVNVVLEGEVELGDNVVIGPGCVIANSRIGVGTQVLAHCVIEQARVGANCRIGPFSRLRPDNQLADGVHIGNFVEIKKSRIAAASKVNHLSYVGDSELGERVNVGAGTITCNYDGANKHLTRIGDDVFIGSDTQLVAPVAIGAGATIGAGSTITKDAPAGALSLSRARQVSVEGWQRPRKEKP